jgi:hypothetical protein
VEVDAASPERVAVWTAMADQFLDTDLRYEIPRIAMACVQAGLTLEEAADVWRYEVSPAVAFNVWDIAGEWEGWDERWLIERIAARRMRRAPGVLDYALYRCRVHFMHEVWKAIERCIRVLLERDRQSRETTAGDLATLARHYFDSDPPALAGRSAEEIARLTELAGTAIHAFEPAAERKERPTVAARVRSALDAAGAKP